MSLGNVLDAVAPLPLPPVDDAWNETPLSTRKQVGRLVNRTVAWLPANLAIIGLVAAILCLSTTETDSSLGSLIGPPIGAIVLAIINTANERWTARKIVLYNRTIEEGYSSLKENRSLSTRLPQVSISKTQELQKQLLTEKVQDRIAFTQECELLFNEKYLIGLLFHYWSNKELKNIFIKQHEAISHRLQHFIDVADTPLFNPPTTLIVSLANLASVLGVIFISGYIMGNNNANCSMPDCSTLKAISRANMAMSIWAPLGTLVRSDLIVKLETRHGELLTLVRSTLDWRNSHLILEIPFLPFGDSIGDRDSEDSLERKDEIKIDILET